jgi:hypothetical protein
MKKAENIKELLIKFWSKDLNVKIVFFVVIMGLAVWLGPFLNANDPDYFWHYRAGEFVVQNGYVPHFDPFSFTMPKFEWVNHEWFSDVILYNVESALGQGALKALYILIFGGTVLFTFLRKKERMNAVDLLAGVLGFVALSDFAGVRQQEYTFLFFAVVLYLLYHENKKLVWMLPALFAVWTNFHGGFALGIVVLGLFAGLKFFGYYFRKDKEDGDYPKYFIVAGLSFLATLLNPYGIHIYDEIVRTVGDSYITGFIVEWNSMFSNFLMRFVIFLAIVLVFAPFLYKKSPKHSVVLLAMLFLMSLKSVKYTPYFILAVLPVMFYASREFLTPAHVAYYKKLATSRAALLLLPILLGGAVLFKNPDIIYVGSEPQYPSNEAVEFLKKDSGKNVFDFYNWGGYLIRYAPEKKYFIDGRMPSWKDGDLYAFKDFISAATCEKTAIIFNKFSVDSVIWPSRPGDRKMFFETEMLKNADKWISSEIFGKKAEKDCDLIKEFNKIGWKKVFDDGNAAVFKKK